MLSRVAFRSTRLLSLSSPFTSTIPIGALSLRPLPRQHHAAPRALCSAPTSSPPSGSTSALSDSEKIRLLTEDGVAPATGRPLSAIAAEIWDHTVAPVGAGHRSGLKILKRPLKGQLYTSWYPEAPAKNPNNPFKLTEKQERWREKLAILRASGRGPPKKGSGKRSK